MVNRNKSPYGRTRYFKGGKLSTWMIKKCKRCGKFIGKFRWKNCDVCINKLQRGYKKIQNKRRYEANKGKHHIQSREYYHTHPKYRKYLNERRKILRRIKKIQIGDYI